MTSSLLRALRNAVTGDRLSDKSVFGNVALHYGRPLKLTDLPLFGPQVTRATAATNPLEHGADIAKVQEWLGHANIQTTRVYDRRHTRA